MDGFTSKRVALVILEDSGGRIALQLRDDIATIAHPNHWALFGGKIEEGERPLCAAVREIEEELTITLNSSKLVPLRVFHIEPGKEHHLFHYSVADELDSAVLREGQLYKRLSRKAIQQIRIDDRNITPSHLEMLNWYWQNVAVSDVYDLLEAQ